DLMLVAWAQASGTGVPRQVFQAANLTKLTSTGVFEMSKSINAIDIYPNPATDKIKIDVALTETEDLKIMLIDMQGKSVEIREIAGTAGIAQIEFSTIGLNAGVYHVAVTDAHRNSFVKRIVIVK
ncbi:MAG TPA: T9SS type A sorting domain-containing protein, partial [Bacteroidia bacterium]|nr:T9SS type A sorting domain-containing protein [Bacteroidia bacterium]